MAGALSGPRGMSLAALRLSPARCLKAYPRPHRGTDEASPCVDQISPGFAAKASPPSAPCCKGRRSFDQVTYPVEHWARRTAPVHRSGQRAIPSFPLFLLLHLFHQPHLRGSCPCHLLQESHFQRTHHHHILKMLLKEIYAGKVQIRHAAVGRVFPRATSLSLRTPSHPISPPELSLRYRRCG